MTPPHTLQAASALLGLAQDYFTACLEGNEFAASEASRGMIEALQSRHLHSHLKLLLMPDCMARRAQNSTPTALIAMPLSVFEKVVKPLLEMLENGEDLDFRNDWPSFAERVWPRVTRN